RTFPTLSQCLTMRLLERKPDGELVLTEYIGKVPLAYAILSHTWLSNHQEVTLQDVEAGTGRSKAGWKKITFCADKAAADGLRYFWIDTCCIDKKNAVELAIAINSMFRQHEQVNPIWGPAFRKSRWFTRGWTLQELIASTLVDFYSLEGERLGSKLSLEIVVHEITGIARGALRGVALSNFNIEERKSWLNANDEDSLELSFRDIAQQVLKHCSSTNVLASMDLDGDLDQIPDNPDGLAVDLRQFLSRSDHGSVIIITRSSQVSLNQYIYIQKLLDIQEGIKILSNTSGRENIENDPDAIELIKELDGLPLALSTASAYLKPVTTSFSKYLRLHKESWLKLQTTSPRLISYKDRSLYTTWQITFDRIQQRNAASAKLLKLWAYFDRQDIWFELL
ncbi:hypothetical protein GJ744_005218, partial [Endocarpon pusillum]